MFLIYYSGTRRDGASLCRRKSYIGGLKSIGRYKEMENKLKSYETLFVISPDLSEEDTKAIVEKFTTLIKENGEIGEIDEWGRRKLAYPIDYKTEGYYVLVNFKSATDFPSELERIFNITDNILRSLVIAKEEKDA